MGLTDRYWIRRQDLGPYARDCKDYWIPGYQTAAASRPIPADGATNAKRDTDLIWLHGWQSDRAHVYFGTDPDAVAKATPKSPQSVGHHRHNIVTPPRQTDAGQDLLLACRCGRAGRQGHPWNGLVVHGRIRRR